MTIALVAMLALLMGMLQIQLLGRAQTQTLYKARELAGQQSMQSGYASPSKAPQIIANWDKGADGATYSRDDVVKAGNSSIFSASIAAAAKPNTLQFYARGNPISNLLLPGNLFLVYGHGESEPIPIYPVVRSLLYKADEIRMESEAWLTWGHVD